jgi:Uma2 family endonuclease
MSEAARHMRHISADALFDMPDDGVRRELVRGEIRTMTPTGALHGVIVARITVLIGQYVDAHHLGCVLGAETRFTLTTAPDTVRAPDVGFVRSERIPAGGPPEKYWPGAPDLAVEVLSPDDRIYEVDDKVDDWLRAGARVVWIVNPRRRTVTEYRSDRPPLTLQQTDRLEGGDLLPGFTRPVATLFPATL